jgi:hypothetical protein
MMLQGDRRRIYILAAGILCLWGCCVYGMPDIIRHGRWVDADNLHAGDKLLVSDGTEAVITDITEIDTDSMRSSGTAEVSAPAGGPKSCDIPTYNLEVDRLHTYYAGSSGVLVHNSNPMRGACNKNQPVAVDTCVIVHHVIQQAQNDSGVNHK